MDCEACTDQMVDLLYGELDDADAEAVRAHLDGCASCTEAYARVESGLAMASSLPLLDAPEAPLLAVMRAAREKAGERVSSLVAEAPVERVAPPRDDEPIEEEASGLWASLLKWIGGFAMRPQLAMALTLFLMVGIGLWYLPELRRDDPSDSHAIVDPAPGDEAGPSAALEPAEPLELEADPRTGRIRPREAGAELERVRVEAPRDQAVAARTAEDVEPTEPAPAMEPPPPDDRAELAEAPVPAEAMAELDIAPGESTALAPELAGAPSATASPAAPPAPAAYAAEAQGAAPTQQPAADGAEGRYARGMERYRAADYEGAAVDFDSVVRRPSTDTRRLLPSALHQLARSHRAAGDCRDAIPAYERLLAQYATYSGGPQAMIEAADCYRRMGRLSEARRMLERAEGHPAVASAARREMTRLDAAERAHTDVPAEAAAEPASSY